MATLDVDHDVISRIRRALPERLPPRVRTQRKFAGKGRSIRSAAVADVILVPEVHRVGVIALVRLEYVDGHGELYSSARSPSPPKGDLRVGV